MFAFKKCCTTLYFSYPKIIHTYTLTHYRYIEITHDQITQDSVVYVKLQELFSFSLELKLPFHLSSVYVFI